MTRRRITRAPGWLVMLALGAGVCVGLHAQGRSVEQLRADLTSRYTVAPVQRGVALVPRRSDANFRIVEVIDGVIEVDGDRLTGRELRERLARDADLILQVSYLGRDELAILTAPSSGAATDAAPPAGGPPVRAVERPQVRNGDLVRIGGSVRVARDERVDGDVIVVFGSADIDGEVAGEITVVMGSLNLGADALVQNDVMVVGGNFNRQPGARVLGSVDEVGIGDRSRRGGDIDFDFWSGNPFRPFLSRAGNFAGTVLRMTLMMLFALGAVALGRASVERIADKTAGDPLRSGFVGLLAELLFIPLVIVVIVVLAVSIVGIPLLVLVPFGMLAVGVLMMVGFSGLAYHLGRTLTGRFGWSSDGGYLQVTVGVVAIMAVTLITRLAALAIGSFAGAPFAVLGYVVEYIAWTIGFGAALLAWFGARQRSRSGPDLTTPPPPLPSES